MSDPASRIRVLDWDSAFFGRRLARIEPGALTEAVLGDILRVGEETRIDGFSYLADPADASSLRALEHHAFALVDVRLEMDSAVAQDGASEELWLARHEDVESLMAIARTSHRNTRFHVDSGYGAERADELYAVWVERSVRGELADAVLVPKVNGHIAGYITLSRRADHAAQIGLLAVAEPYRRRGVGRSLLSAAQQWCREQGRTLLQVVTPGRTSESLRFYERAGFVTRRIGLWYHRWM